MEIGGCETWDDFHNIQKPFILSALHTAAASTAAHFPLDWVPPDLHLVCRDLHTEATFHGQC